VYVGDVSCVGRSVDVTTVPRTDDRGSNLQVRQVADIPVDN